MRLPNDYSTFRFASDGGPVCGLSSRLRKTCAIALLFSMLGMNITAAPAQILPDRDAPSQQRPHVVSTANGTPQVNIQTPGREGISRNAYRQFDVDAKGAILNNSRENAETRTGGWVQGNPNLATGEARVIVNEVNSLDPSRLHGQVEVAGQRAEVIIANPAGLHVDGAGFVNASGITLTTGTPEYRNGAVDGYRVERGRIQVAGDGLDTRDSDYTAVLARAVEVQSEASVLANDLTVVAGANRVSADHRNVASIEGREEAPEVAVDVARLGGMYAGKIHLLATEDGVGVRNAGQIGTQAGELRLSADGRLENTGVLQSASNVEISATGGLTNSGNVSAARELTVTTPRDIDNSDGTLNARRLELRAGSLTNLYGEIEQTGVQALRLEAGSFSNRDGGRIGLAEAGAGGEAGGSSATGNSGAGTGSTGAGSEGSASGGETASGGAGSLPEVLDDGRLSIVGTLDNDGGTISAANMDLTSTNGLDNDGGHLGLGQLTVTSGDLSNRDGELIIDGEAVIHAREVNNDRGYWQVTGPLTFESEQFFNRGGTLELADTGATDLDVQGVLDNSKGRLASQAETLTFTTGSLRNQGGDIEHAGENGLNLYTGAWFGRDGSVATAGAMQVNAGDVDHRGATLSATQLTLTADDFDSRGGDIRLGGSNPNTLTVTNTLNNGNDGFISSNGDLTLQAATFNNSEGRVAHSGTGELSIHAPRLEGAGGVLASNGSLILEGDRIDLRDGTTQAQRIRVDTGDLVTADGHLVALSDDTLDLQASRRIDNQGGTIQTAGDVALNSAGLDNRGGELYGSAVVLDTHRQRLDNSGGTIATVAGPGNGRIVVNSGELRNDAGGLIQSLADLNIDTSGRGLSNTDSGEDGGLISGGAMTLDTRSLDTRGLETGDLTNDAGTIRAQDEITLMAGEVSNLWDGVIVGASDVTLDAVSLENADGTVRADDQLTVTVDQQVDNRGGVLLSREGDLALTSGGKLANIDQGLIQASGKTTVTSSGLDNADGTILGSAVDINTRQQKLDNSGGTIATLEGVQDGSEQGPDVGSLTINSGTLVNGAGLIQSLADLNIDTAGQTLINFDSGEDGGLISGGTMTLAAGDITNDAGVIRARDGLKVHAGAVNILDGGTVVGGDDVTLSVASLDNQSGAVISTLGDVFLTSDGKLTNTDQGLIQAAGKTTITSSGLDNADGTILGSTVGINTRQQRIDNSGGTIASVDGAGDGAVAITSGTLINDAGLIQSLADLSIDTDGQKLANTNSGDDGGLISGGVLTLTTGDITNDAGVIRAQDEIRATAAALSNLSGSVVAGENDVTLEVASLDNTGGTVLANDQLTVTADHQVDNQGGALIASEGDIVLTGGGKLTNAGDEGNGLIQASGSTTITSSGLDNSVAEGQGSENLGSENQGGTILGSTVDINTRQRMLDNSGGIIATLEGVQDGSEQGPGVGSLTINSGELVNDAGLIQSIADLSVNTAGKELTNSDSGDDGGLISGGALTLEAGDITNDAGAIRARDEIKVTAEALSNLSGGVVAGENDVTLEVASLDNAGGAVLANDQLTVTADQQIDNQGGALIASEGDINLTSGGKLTNAGDEGNGLIQASGSTTITSSGLDNSVAEDLGSENQGGTILGSTVDINTRQRMLDNSGGTIATLEGVQDGSEQGPDVGSLTINSGTLVNDAGLIQSFTDLSIDTSGKKLTNTDSGENGGLLSGGAMYLSTGELDNGAGVIFAGTDLDVDADTLSNREAGLLGGGGDVELAAASLDNAGGTVLSEGDLVATFESSAGSSINNLGGLISAGNALSLTADAIDNRDTRSASSDDVLGVQGDSVALTANSIDNTSGVIAADSHVGIAGTGADSQLDNEGGLVSSLGTIDIVIDEVSNSAGSVSSQGNQSVTTDQLSGDGELLSHGDLILALVEDFTNTGEVTANGNVEISTQGKLTNSGTLQADELDLEASTLDNTVDGVIRAALTQVTTSGTLTNRGLIDGNNTRLQVGTLDNIGTGRIYGDHLAIQADTLNNREETLGDTTSAATIAARERLDIGVETLTNREEALIFSAGQGADALTIAGQLDSDWHGTGRADRVDNISATIESLGGLNIHARELNNTNAHFATEEVLVSDSVPYVTVSPDKEYPGERYNYDASLFDWYRGGSGGFSQRDEDDNDFENRPGWAGFIVWNGTPPPKDGVVLGWTPSPRVADADYPSTDPAWEHFGVTAPEPEPREPQSQDFASEQEYQAAHEQWQTEHADWEAQTEQRYEALDNKIVAYNSAFGTPEHIDSRQVNHIQDWTQYDGEISTYETQVVESAPGLIRSGGDMTLTGETLVNDKSRIIAGGAMSGDLDRLENIDAEGTRRVHYEEGGNHWFTDGKGKCGGNYCQSRDWSWEGSYQPADVTTTIDLAVSEVKTQQSGTGGDHTPDDVSVDTVADQARGQQQGPDGEELNGVSATGQDSERLTLAEVSGIGPEAQGVGLHDVAGSQRGPDSQIVEVVALADDAPDAPGAPQSEDAQGETVARATQDAPAVIRTTPLSAQVPASSLYQLDPAPTAEVLVETDPRFTDRREWLSSDYMLKAVQQDPTATHKRLGDGFYEQRLITEQIMQLTGQRYLSGHHSDEDQFRALMNAGLTFAEAHELRPGIALTAEQMAQLTSDIVWLVEQEVTLADGSTEKVLVPQVYVRVREGDLRGDGTLLAGNSVDLEVEGDLVNSGTIAGRTAVKLDADNIRNLNGRITGESVKAHAQTDLENIGGTIDAERLLEVSAGRDIRFETTTTSGERRAGDSSFSHTGIDRVAGLYVTGEGGLIDVNAGRDVALVGTEIDSAGHARIDAGRDLSLETVALSRFDHTERDSRNYATRQHDSEFGSSITSDGTLQMEAGRDFHARAAQVDAGGNLIVKAENDVTIESGEDRRQLEARSYSKHSGFLSSKTRETYVESDESRGIASQFGGDHVLIDAGNDVRVVGSDVQADDELVVKADRNLSIEASEYRYHYASDEKESGFLSDARAEESHDVQANRGSHLQGREGVTLVSGEDTHLLASRVDSEGDVAVEAGGNVLIASGTDRESYHQEEESSGFGLSLDPGLAGLGLDFGGSEAEGQHGNRVTNAPSQVTAGGNVDIQAGTDISLIGSRVEAGGGAPRTPDESSTAEREDSDGGNIRLSAGRDINLSPGISGSDQLQWESESRYGISFDSDENSVSMFVGRESESEGHGLASLQSVGSELSAAGNVEVNAGRDITQIGGRTSAGDDINYNAERNVNLLSGSSTERTTETREQTRSGFGTSVNHNFGNARDAIQGAGEGDNTVSQASSTLKAVDTVSRTAAGPTFSGSLGRSGEDVRASGEGVRAAPAELNAGGSISIGAGKDATLEGTRVNAGEDIRVEAENIFVRPGAESTSQQTEARHEWSGIRQEGNSVGGGASLGVDTADIEQTSGAGAQLAAGGDVGLIAEDALRIEGSGVAAGNNVRLEGTTVDILASRGDYSEVHDGEQIGGEVGITLGGDGGTLGYYVEVEGGQNDLVRDDQQHRNSRITAGERLEVVSTDDTTIAGANLTGNELDLDVGGDLLVSSVQDEGAVDGQRRDGKVRVTVGAGVSVSGSAGYGETEGEKAWVEDQTSLIGRESVDIDTAGHTQVDGAVIANIREDGSDGGNLSLTTDTLSVTDIHDSHTEDSHYTRVSGSWESDTAAQSRGSDSDYTQTTGKPRGDETGDTLDERTTWGIEGSYSSLDREQINRGTIGQGEITVHNPDSDLNTDIADINRDIDQAQEITRDESETTELYVTETSVEDAANPVDTVNRWGEQLQNLPEKYADLPQEVRDNYVQLGRGVVALVNSAPEETAAALELLLLMEDSGVDAQGLTEDVYDTLILKYGKDAADVAMEGIAKLDNPLTRSIAELHRDDPVKAQEVLSYLDQQQSSVDPLKSNIAPVVGGVIVFGIALDWGLSAWDAYQLTKAVATGDLDRAQEIAVDAGVDYTIGAATSAIPFSYTFLKLRRMLTGKADEIADANPGVNPGATDGEMIGQPGGAATNTAPPNVPGRVQSRVNLATGDSSSGWEHVVGRHFNPDRNASQFTVSQSDLRTMLQSPEVVNTPVTRTLSSADHGTLYVREVDLGRAIGTEKFNSFQPTSTMTVMTDRFGNLVTATPGVVR